MAVPYSTGTIRKLEQVFASQEVYRPFRLQRHEAGAVLCYDLRGVLPDNRARIRLEIERFIGGGYAGQVYKVRLQEAVPAGNTVVGLEIGRAYALKILIPPSEISRRIRNLFYGIGFQAPFSLQALAAAGRSQALWQKFIRRAAGIVLGREDAVADIVGTVLDAGLGSYGELSEWVDGRMWRFEVDDDLDGRKAWRPGMPDGVVGSVEYRAKKSFMRRFVRLMHELGAGELARQYEWWSLKSQPNVMKRTASDPDPRAGLTAIDFRAGMALLPFAPQCPADIKLILRGLARGRLVQFDKGDIVKLERFVDGHPEGFADMRGALEDLKKEDRTYRDSLIDVTYHPLRLLAGRIRHQIMEGFRESWRVRNMVDQTAGGRMEKNRLLSLLFLLLAFVPLAAPALFIFAWPGRKWELYPLWLLPLLAPFLRRLWGRADLRRHYARMLTSFGYLLRAGRARIAESMVRWVRSGRVSEERALLIAGAAWRYYLHSPLSMMPPLVHRFLTDKAYFRERLRAIFVQPVRLLIKPAERERWLLEMIGRGEESGLLSAEEASRIRGQVKEPYIQKYLKSLAVHMATLFVSETVFLTAAVSYVLGHPDLSWQQATLQAGVIIAALNLLPISPGSLVRGFYVIGLMIKERNFKDYNIAFGVSFLKIIGYLAFPIQMTYRFPDLARFMAGHWATEAVNRVPVFGEKGAWLEHFVFDAFYNYPLTVRRRVRERAMRRAGEPGRIWHVALVSLGAAGALAGLGAGFVRISGGAPSFGRFWWLAVWVPLGAGALTALAAGGMKMGRRLGWGLLAGASVGLFYGIAPFVPALAPAFGAATAAAGTPLGLAVARGAVEKLLLFGVLGLVGAVVVETRRVR